jgi:DNA-binding MarR family transcriptional regulator
MAEIFLGDLSQIRLFDILKPLLSEKKTGKVSFKGKESGEIYLEMGNITHAKTGSSFGEYAFFTIMEWKGGSITFELEVTPKERTIPAPTEQLLLNWSYRKQEWEKIREMIPHSNIVFRLSLQTSGEETTVSADQWNVLALCNGIRSVGEIGKTLNWDEYKTLRTLHQLIRGGLLERVEGAKLLKRRLVGESFFQKTEDELKRMMGPVAPFLIDDKLMEFGETKESLTHDQALSFIESLSEEIPQDSKRKDFVRMMKDFLSTGK